MRVLRGIRLYAFLKIEGRTISCVPCDAVLYGRCDGLNNIVPVIPNITKGWYDEHISKNFDKIVANSATNGVAAGNLGWWILLSEQE